MTAKEKAHLIEVLTQYRIRDRKKMSEASHNIDNLRRKAKGSSSVEIIRKFRGPI